MNFSKTVLFTVLFGFQALLAAAPSVSTVDSSRLSAGEIIIHGSNFGPGPNVDIFDNFDSPSASHGANVPLASPQIGAWTSHNTLPVYNTQSHSGNFSAQMFDTIGSKQFVYNFNQPIREAFVSYWVRIPNGTPFPGNSVPGTFGDRSSWKFAWLIDQDYAGNSSDICMPSHVGSGNFKLAGNSGNVMHSLGNAWWSWTSWVRIAVWLRDDPSDPSGLGDAMFHTVSSEKRVAEDRRRVNTQPQYQYITMPGWMKGGATPLYDDVYIASGPNAIAHVELTDSANYSQSRIVAIQPATSWSGNRITVDVNQGGFPNLNNVYVFVWDKDGNRNSVGYPLSGGGGVAPPDYPGNIQ